MSESKVTKAPKKIINQAENGVSEMIQGLLQQYPTQLQKLSNHNVLLSSTINYDKVNILSGGGSGHEPSHAGWIGSRGMLTGAILGGIFASPSVSSILAAIRAVTRVNNEEDKGCLLIVKNYTGDRLNFGMACERANAEGRKCAMVVVADDCALAPSKGITGARGVAGTVWVHKVAGAAAEKGMELEEVAELATVVAGRIGTLGVALDAVTIPGAVSVNDRLEGDIIEIGLGIHGEAGIRQSPLLSANQLADIMVRTIMDYGEHTFAKGDQVAVMVNNLGGTSNFEMSILANSVLQLLESEAMGHCHVTRLYVGSFMTSFDMHGASVSILSFTNADTTSLADLLDQPTDAPAWQSADTWNVPKNGPRPSLTELPEQSVPETALSYDHIALSSELMDTFSNLATTAIQSACQALIESEPILTKYDLIVGDGDCGLTMQRGAKQILTDLESGVLQTSHPIPLFSSLADAVSASMGGTSGVLLELMFRKMSTFLLQQSSTSEINVLTLAQALEQGVHAVSFYGGASVGSRTMLDALVPAVQVLNNNNSSSNNGGALKEAAKAATDGANQTAAMLHASAGRSNYLSQESLQGTPDPGAFAVSIVFNAIC